MNDLLHPLRARTALVLVPFLLACNGDDDVTLDPDGGSPPPPTEAGPPATTADAGGPQLPLTVTWKPCSLEVGEDDGLAECAVTDMPFSSPEDPRTFPSAAKRWRAPVPSKGQLWLLAGGPGSSGVLGLASTMQNFREAYPALDIYTLDYRGTGLSQYLGCPAEEDISSEEGEDLAESEFASCAATVRTTLGADAYAYSFTASAGDLHRYIQAMREPGKRVLLWGGSGGTTWAQRYLQLHPRGIDGAILEGIEPADGSLRQQDRSAEAVAREVLRLCGEDAECKAHLPDPEATTRALWAKLEAGHCAALGLRVTDVQQAAYAFTTSSALSGFLPAFLLRVDRCAPHDVTALSRFVTIVEEAFAEPGAAFSEPLGRLLVASELWNDPEFPDEASFLADLDSLYANALFGAGRLGYMSSKAYSTWPTYAEPLDDQWAVTATPLLMLQGALDPATPAVPARRMKEHFAGPSQNYLEFPYAGHDVLGSTPTAAGPDCAWQLAQAFLDDPNASLDTTCVSETLRPDFHGADLAPILLDEENYWGDL